MEDPLRTSAPLAWRLARSVCPDPVTGRDCSPVHGLWQFLRLLRLVRSPADRAPFYGEALARVSGPAPRVLVCGGADYGMLAVALGAFRSRGIEPALTMIDVCETPLALTRWYAQQVRCTLVTRRCSILDYTEEPFDAVCTDHFLGRVAPAERPALIAKWRSLLRKGGIVATLNRVRPGAGGREVAFSDAQERALCEAVRAAAQAQRENLPASPEELARAAAAYARQHRTWPVESGEAMRAFFEAGGFRVEALRALEPAAASPADARSGPSISHAGSLAVAIVASAQ